MASGLFGGLRQYRVIKMETKMRHVLSPAKVRQMYLQKIRTLAHAKWEAAGKPEGGELDFWLAAEQEQREKDMRFGGTLAEPALPNYERGES